MGGGGGICALKVAGTRCGQVVCGRKASWLEAAQQGENVRRTSDLEGGREGGVLCPGFGSLPGLECQAKGLQTL